ncbi:hypothetical protein [Halomicrococcus gelatinilyticus]|uniref:hypothetical protein n=1 Tax=Halomicrococcus gelatinilyticus TaxID=1702103 RepID=UPI002E119C18
MTGLQLLLSSLPPSVLGAGWALVAFVALSLVDSVELENRFADGAFGVLLRGTTGGLTVHFLDRAGDAALPGAAGFVVAFGVLEVLRRSRQ